YGDWSSDVCSSDLRSPPGAGRRPAPGGDLVPGEPLRLRAEGAGGGGEGGDRSGAEFSGCAAGQQYVDETLEGVARGQDATSQERCHAPPSCNLASWRRATPFKTTRNTPPHTSPGSSRTSRP